MTIIFIIVETKVSANEKDSFIENVINPLVISTNKEEKNIYYDYININSWNAIIEAYKDEDGVNKHLSTDLFKSLYPKLKEHIYRVKFIQDFGNVVINLPNRQIIHLVVNVKLIPNSSNQVEHEKFITLAANLTKDTRENDYGVIAYTFGKVISFPSVGIEGPDDEYVFVEFWESDEALNAHTERVKGFVEQLDTISTVQYVLKSYFTPYTK